MRRLRWAHLVVILAGCGDNRGAPDAAVIDASIVVDERVVDGEVVGLAAIAVTKMGQGTGEVVSEPRGLACGATCTASFEPGTEVTLVAVPDAGYVFVGWSGDCSGVSPSCTVVPTSGPLDVGATFELARVRIEIDQRDGGGSISSVPPLPASCDSSCEIEIPAGTSITMTAVPLAGSALLSWNGVGCGGVVPCTFIASAALTVVTARFGRDDSVDNGTTTVASSIREGTPLWDVSGWQTVSVFGSTSDRVWCGLHDVGGFSSIPHAPPYASEAADCVALLGWDSGSQFRHVDWSGMRSLLWAAMIVPTQAAPVGSTDDFSAGPIIPNALSLNFATELYRDAMLVYQFSSNILVEHPASLVDGRSHVPLVFSHGIDGGAPAPGNYTMRVHVYESATPSNGWRVELPFVIGP